MQSLSLAVGCSGVLQAVMRVVYFAGGRALLFGGVFENSRLFQSSVFLSVHNQCHSSMNAWAGIHKFIFVGLCYAPYVIVCCIRYTSTLSRVLCSVSVSRRALFVTFQLINYSSINYSLIVLTIHRSSALF